MPALHRPRDLQFISRNYELLAAFLLFRKGVKSHDVYPVTLNGETEFEVCSSIDVWTCVPSGDRQFEKSLAHSRYAFSKNINGENWFFDSNQSCFHTIKYSFDNEHGYLGVETRSNEDENFPDQHIVGIYASGISEKLADYYLNNSIFLRFLKISQYGRQGLLLPKKHGWRVIPLNELSPNPVAFHYESHILQEPHKAIELDSMFSSDQSFGFKPENHKP